ncbi:MAG TPA: hypothetical protein VLJ59_12185 [Mycobacteriales bacterium]|nr:hypothetical protein [Mycobacteriales bacterium]
MPLLITAPSRIPVPSGKTIDEYVGRVNTETAAVSVAVMVAPAGWSEPAQAPAFDEITLVLSGVVRVDHDGGAVEVRAGQAVLARAGERVRYSRRKGRTTWRSACRRSRPTWPGVPTDHGKGRPTDHGKGRRHPPYRCHLPRVR